MYSIYNVCTFDVTFHNSTNLATSNLYKFSVIYVGNLYQIILLRVKSKKLSVINVNNIYKKKTEKWT